jgi:hypothetical protein
VHGYRAPRSVREREGGERKREEEREKEGGIERKM